MKIERTFVIKKGGSERSTIIQEITDLINIDRIKDKRKPYPFLFISYRLAHLKSNQDLYWLLSSGKDYARRTKQPFSKYVFGSIKAKADEKGTN